ncbi:hypothetical protein LCGC14_0414450 [marine sediment metagenome]|uniref:Uncharacterized protein n=1 Tax=marine sediment metagenome TaxID=412755 RepID=A0A0F9SSR4_9ZZZZ
MSLEAIRDNLDEIIGATVAIRWLVFVSEKNYVRANRIASQASSRERQAIVAAHKLGDALAVIDIVSVIQARLNSHG